MRYAVQIPVPSGFASVTPALGLNYSSAAGASVVGVGWSMPMMTIERMTMRGTPEYDKQDYFASNGGDELVLVEDKGQALVYRERFEGAFVRYTWHDVGSGEEGYWTAEYPDGSIGYFGADAEGNVVPSARSTRPGGGVYKYHMVERVDVWGHRMVYTYDDKGGNWPLVSRIGYVFEGSTPYYRVEFEYDERTDKISDAGAGYEELLGHRLTSVAVTQHDTIIREFDLTYESYATSGGFSRLENVVRYGLGGIEGGNAYPIDFTFGYSRALGATCEGADCDSPYLVSMDQAGEAAGLAGGTATLIDINADGLPDIVDTTTQGPHRILINQLVAHSDGTFSHSFAPAMNSTQATKTGFGLGDQITQVADVNGDGLADLFNARSGATLMTDFGQTDWAGMGETLDVTALLSVDMEAARFLDYNNDKLADVITSTSNATTVYENTGSLVRCATGRSNRRPVRLQPDGPARRHERRRLQRRGRNPRRGQSPLSSQLRLGHPGGSGTRSPPFRSRSPSVIVSISKT